MLLRAKVDKLLYGPHRAAQRYKTLNHIELNRSAVLQNVQVLQQQHPNVTIMPVLKGDAYGHGLIEMAEVLNGADCGLLVVDGYFEAAKIRHLTNHRILVLGYILPENTRLLDTKRCSFVVQDLAGLESFGGLDRPVRVHLELNTGMNRLGLQSHELDTYLEVLQKFPKLELEGVMTHLADADNEVDDSFTQNQVRQFDQAVKHILAKGFHPRHIHIAQTAGSTKVKSKHANGLRIGIGLYGVNPLGSRDAHFGDLRALQPVLELKSTIIKVIELKLGDKVSYNGIFTAKKAMRIGILPLGYYEGISRELSNTGVVTYEGLALPIVGRVCMNHTMIDLSSSSLKIGDGVTVISANPLEPNSIAHLSTDHKLFAYTLLTGLSSSIRRRVV